MQEGRVEVEAGVGSPEQVISAEGHRPELSLRCCRGSSVRLGFIREEMEDRMG